MNITQQLVGEVPVIRIEGELDQAASPTLGQVFGTHIRAGNHRVVLDLQSCTYVDSSGLAVIMGEVEELRDDGVLAIVAPDSSVRRLLDLVRLDQHKRCAIFTAESEALCFVAAMPPLGTVS